MLRAFFGRHKSASTWARSIITEAGIALDLKILTIHVKEQWDSYPTLGDMVRDQNPDILIMTRPVKKDVDTLPPFKGVHLIRDPRDIVVSGYFSHRNSHPEVFGGIPWPELVEHRKQLLELDKDAGLEAEIEFSSLFLDPMSDWDYDRPDTLEYRMEELIEDQQNGWDTIFRHYDLLGKDSNARLSAVLWNMAARRETPWLAMHLRKVLPRIPLKDLPPSYVPNALQRFSFTRLSHSDRKPGQVDEHSHYRKGMAGDWVNHLTDHHLAVFRKRYGDLIERLGYR